MDWLVHVGGTATLDTPPRTSTSPALPFAVPRRGGFHCSRTQAAYHNHPLSGDRKYGGTYRNEGFFLHSLTIRFNNDNSGLIKENITASPTKDEIKRLNRVLPGCRIEELTKKIFMVLEEL